MYVYTNGEELLTESGRSYCNAKFENFVIPTGHIENKKFSNCIFKNVIFVNCEFHDINFMDCEFHNVKFQTCSFAACVFERAYIFISNFQNCSFGGCTLHARRRFVEPVYFVDNTTFAGLSGFYCCTFFRGIVFKDCHVPLGAILNISNCTFNSQCIKENIEFLKPYITQHCPSHGGFVGWKVVEGCIISRGFQDVFESHGPLIAKIYIPTDAKRVNGPGPERKCRCNKAKVLEYYRPEDMKPVCPDYVTSIYNKNFKYPGIGEYIKPDKFDDSVFTECSNGIHFFLTLEEALVYSLHF